MPVTDIFITVRLKSTRLPRKAFAEVSGQTVIEHIIDRARQIKRATHIILCTSVNDEDSPLCEIAEKKGIPYFRGSEDNIIDRFVGAAAINNPDIGVRITGDNCLFSPEMVDLLLEEHIMYEVEYTSTKQLPGGAKGDVFSVDALKKLHKMLQDSLASEYLSWLFADERFFKVKWVDVPAEFNRPHYRLHCDTPADLAFLRVIYKKLYNGKDIVDFRKAMELLDNHPEIVEINKEIKQISKDMLHNKINFELKNQ